MGHQPSTSGSLVQRIGAGDHTAEQELVDKYWKGLRFILNKRCSNFELAADITQDALIVVIAKARAGEINNPEALSVFIRQTGVNLLIAHFRKETRRATDSFGEVNVEMPDTKTDLLRQVESRETLNLVRQLMDEVKIPRDRDILVSYYVKEEEKLSICDRLGIDSAHFDKVLFRARGRLKQLVDFKLGGLSGT